MKLIVVNASVVLVGQMYNPALFTHDSVRLAKIVKRSWALVQTPIMSPAISILRYDNGLNLLVEQNRAQILFDKPPHNLSQTPLIEVANNVLRRLSNVRHTAVGINFTAIIEHDAAAEFLRAKFIKENVLHFGGLKEFGLVFSYTRAEDVLNINYSSGNAHFEKDEHTYIGILITANYHVDLPASVTLDSASKAAKEQITRATERYDDFLALMAQIFELEEETNDAT